MSLVFIKSEFKVFVLNGNGGNSSYTEFSNKINQYEQFRKIDVLILNLKRSKVCILVFTKF